MLYHTLSGLNRVLGVPREVAVVLHAMRESLVNNGLGWSRDCDARLVAFEASALHECLASGNRGREIEPDCDATLLNTLLQAQASFLGRPRGVLAEAVALLPAGRHDGHGILRRKVEDGVRGVVGEVQAQEGRLAARRRGGREAVQRAASVLSRGQCRGTHR